jgi:glycosyltransferase involved in cell wall biosynthesis
LKDAIIYLMKDEKKRERIASSAWRIISDNHTWQRNAEKVLEIYNSIIIKNASNPIEIRKI